MATQSEFPFYSRVDDELYDELAQLAGQKIVHAALWEDSLADAIASRAAVPSSGSRAADSEDAVADDPDAATTLDLDLYLVDGVYFELYATTLFVDPDGDPVSGREPAETLLRDATRHGYTLGEVAVDEDDALVLVLHQGANPVLYLAAGGFVLEEWDELPV